jgi:hypothetical protein
MNETIINVYNHETGESFQIVTLEKFILWLNDNDDIFTFVIKKEKGVTL